MIVPKPPRVPRLEGVRRRLDRWRRTRRSPRSPIPAPIWESAVALAGHHGLYRTARALRLDYGALKAHLDTTDRAATEDVTAPAFVELARITSPVLEDCVIEVDGRQTILRIRLKGVGCAEVARLSRALAGVDA